MIDPALRRRFFAEEIEAVCHLRSATLVDALAAVPREHFLPPGPWTVLGEADLAAMGPAKAQRTPDANPARVYHNVGIAIDPARNLFNGQPGTLAGWIDALALTPGARVLHVGAGLGYYTAVMAHCVGPSGRVLAFEADAALAATAQLNLASMPWVEVRAAASADPGHTRPFDAILINAGVTHPLDCWLDTLVAGGRLVLPLTVTMPAMGSIGKGFVFLLQRGEDGGWTASLTGFVAIYSAVGVRDDALNAALGKTMMAGLQRAQAVTRLRRDVHEPEASCWFHGSRCCFST
jgi:protein-L-isoaspartate(D-aspartate) O-methyltransferase